MDRIRVYVTAFDPILDIGVSAQLRARPELWMLRRQEASHGNTRLRWSSGGISRLSPVTT